MTLTLVLDTATAVATVGVGDDSGISAELSLGRRRHAASLVPAVLEVLRQSGATLADVGRIVLADGPGSFTGLRIGVATMQGIVRAREHVRVGTTPSLMVTARGAADFVDGPVAALYDALRGEVFGAVYRFSPERVETLVSPTRTTIASLRDRSPGAPAAVVGDGAAAYAAEVAAWCGHPPVGPPAGSPRAAALLALDRVADGVSEVPDPFAFTPTYGRPAEAQARWEKTHGRPLPDSPGQLR